MTTIENNNTIVSFVSLELEIKGQISLSGIDLGSVTLKCENREFILDVVYSIAMFNDGVTNISCELERDDETFPDCKYDLTVEDITSKKLTVEAFVEGCVQPKINLLVQIGSEMKTIKVQREK